MTANNLPATDVRRVRMLAVAGVSPPAMKMGSRGYRPAAFGPIR